MKSYRSLSVNALFSALLLLGIFWAGLAQAALWEDWNIAVLEGDYNNDGEMDLVLQSSDNVITVPYAIDLNFKGQYYVLLGNGDGTYGAPQPVGNIDVSNMVPSNNYEVLIGDLNGNGHPDLLLKNSTTGESLVLYSDATGAPVNVVQFATVEGFNLNGTNAVLKDVNGDGQQDLIIDFGDGQSVVAFAEPDGSFNETRGGVVPQTVPGTSSGDFEVGKDGSANYSVPIAVPVGGAGMQPSLAFSYSSSNGNGHMGYGWGVSQPSMIVRCSTTYIDDGYIDDEQYLCLDGQRLIYYQGNYYPANDPSTKVESISGRNAYKVYYKSGEIAVFGNHDGSHSDALELNPDVWHLSKIEDRSGNTRSYSYNNNGSENYLEKITYPGGEVVFTYTGGRSDQQETWYKGARSVMTQTLQRVETKVGNQIYRSYDLEYSESTIGNKTRLEKITECGADATCLAPLTFDWIENSSADIDTQVTTSLASENGWQRSTLIDMNGDGFTDIFIAEHSIYYVRLNNGDATFGTPIALSMNNNRWQYTFPMDINSDGRMEMIVPRGGGTDDSYFGLKVISFDAGSLSVSPLTITSFANLNFSNNRPTVLDIDGNGRPDLVVNNGNKWSALMNYDGSTLEGIPGQSASPVATTGIGVGSSARVIDMDGDGKQDLLYKKGGKLWVMESSLSSGTSSLDFIETEVMADAPDDMGSARLGDFNGDGRLDIAYKQLVGSHLISYNDGDHALDITENVLDFDWAININQGGVFGPRLLTVKHIEYNNRSQIFDVNGDGFDDIVYFTEFNRVADDINGIRNLYDHEFKYLEFNPSSNCLSTGTGCFTKKVIGYGNIAYNALFRVADLNQDGLVDILTQSDNYWRVLTRQNQLPQNYMSGVTNGYGLKTEFLYGGLYDGPTTSSSSYYEKNFDPITDVFPLINVSGPLHVVRKTTVYKDITGRSNEVSYKYKKYMSHLQGLGILGFQEITSNTAWTEVHTVYSQNWQKHTHGLPISESVRKKDFSTGSLKIVSNTTYVNALSEFITNNGKFRFSYVDTKTEQYNDLSNNLVKTVTTDYKPDFEESGFEWGANFGDIEEVTVNTVGGGETHTITTTNEYALPDTANWVIGRLSNTAVLSTGTNRISTARNSAWEYYPNGYLSAEIIEPGKDEFKRTTAYTYNALGLKETTITSVEDPAISPRSTTTYYDSLGRYPIQVQTELGSIYTSYDPILGLQTSSKDLNGNTSYASFDGFGRPKTNSNPDGSTITTAFVDASSYVASNSGPYSHGEVTDIPAEYYIEKTDQNGLWSRTFYDRAGNAFESHALNAFDQVVVTRTEYDSYGMLLRQSEPYFLGATNRYWTETTARDPLQRPLSIVNPEGNVSSISYDGLTTTTTNEKLQTKTEVRTVDGKLFEVTDNDGHTVRYGYDAAGNMTSMTDLVDQGGSTANDITTTINYDVLGRKTSMNDPDKGNWAYDYNPFGELVLQTDAKGDLICQAYDTLGRMVKRVDNYNGSLLQAKNHCEAVAFDPEAIANANKSAPETTQWIYDTAANGNGKLHRVTGPNGYSETLAYDFLSRLETVTKVIAGQSYVTSTSYDSQSRPENVVYPGGLKVNNHYNARGALTEIRKSDNVDGNYYWKLNGVDHRGNATDVSLGGGAINTQKVYTPERGFVERIQSSTLLNAGDLQSDYFEYDELANVGLRRNEIIGSEEIASYDSINRLGYVDRTVAGASQPRENMAYSYKGNIQSKWDVTGTYQYGGTCNSITAGPHAVTQANGNTYCYDQNGNMISGAGRTIEWNVAGKPTLFTRGPDLKVEFEYGPDRKRIRRIDTKDSITTPTTTTYVGNYEKVEKSNGAIDERYYIGGIVVVNQLTSGSTVAVEENYLLKDNLGSVVSTVSLADLLASPSSYKGEQSTFNPWGLRRNADWTEMSLAALYTYKSDATDRGFTGHEQIDEIGLVHMNGRVYDPVLGRFISADPIIQSPTDLQSLNRYSYVRNNPLTLIDPSGFGWLSKKWKSFKKTALYRVSAFGLTGSGLREFGRFARKHKYVAEITQIVGCIVTAPAGPGGCAAVSAAVTYGVSDGDFKAAARAGATAYAQSLVAGEIGGSTLGEPGLVLAHGALGGTVSFVQGGKFGHGFAAGAFAKAATLGLQAGAGDGGLYAPGAEGGFAKADFNSVAARTTIAAAIGGTVSELSGGTFANGAVTAAMQHLFNAESAEEQQLYESSGFDEKLVADINYTDLSLDVVSFAAGIGEAGAGLFLMLNPATFLPGAALVSHSFLGLSNTVLSINSNLSGIKSQGVLEAIGGASFGKSGQMTGAIFDHATSLGGAVRGAVHLGADSLSTIQEIRSNQK